MYKAILVASHIQAGRNVISELVGRNIPIKSAFWHYFDEEAAWRLILVTPGVTTRGPRALFATLLDILTDLHNRQIAAISADEVMFVAPTSLLYKQVQKGGGLFVRTGPPADVVVEDTYVYSQ